MSLAENSGNFKALLDELYEDRRPPEEEFKTSLDIYNVTNIMGFVDEGAFIASYCGVDYSQDFYDIWQCFVFWCEGVLLMLIGILGILGNTFSTCALVSVESLWSPFHYLLIGLSMCDLLFLLISIPIHAFPLFDFCWLVDLLNSWPYCVVYQFVLYPFSTVAYSAGVFITVAIAIERFHIVCFPQHYHNTLAPSTPFRRARLFIIPAIIVALLLNMHKFFEVQIIKVDEETYVCTIFEQTTDVTIVSWLKRSYIIHPFFANTFFPIIVLFILNSYIYRGIKTKQQNRPNTLSNANGQGQQTESRQQATLIIIVIVFMLTHFPRLILSFWAFLQRDKATNCALHQLPYIPSLFVLCLEAVSNLLIHINGSLNFFFYTFTSQQLKAILLRIFGGSQEVRTNNPAQNQSAQLLEINTADKGVQALVVKIESSHGQSQQSQQHVQTQTVPCPQEFLEAIIKEERYEWRCLDEAAVPGGVQNNIGETEVLI